jgi:hypothetical protein
MNMALKYTFRSFLILIIWLFDPYCGVNAQSLDELEKKHGFQDIILDTDISENPQLVYKKQIDLKKSEFPIHVYVRNKDSYPNIGEVPIKDMEVKVYLQKIVEIKIITPKETDIMKALKKLYGEPSFSVRSNAWEWQTEGVLLSLTSLGKKKLEIKYASRKLNQYIKDKKEEGIQDLSTDF